MKIAMLFSNTGIWLFSRIIFFFLTKISLSTRRKYYNQVSVT